FIIVGAIAGFLAGKVMTGHGLGLIWDIVVGILGAFLGGWLAGLVGIAVTSTLALIIVAFVGAVILLGLFRLVTSREWFERKGLCNKASWVEPREAFFVAAGLPGGSQLRLRRAPWTMSAFRADALMTSPSWKSM